MATPQTALSNTQADKATAKAQALMSRAISLGVSADDILARMGKGETIEEIIEDQEFALLEARENAEIEARKRAGKPALLNPIRADFPLGTQGELAYLSARVAYLEAARERNAAGKITLKVSAGGTERKDKNGKPTGEKSPGGALSIYGLNRFPITAYLSGAVALFSESQCKAVREFLVANYSQFTQKAGSELTLEQVKAKLAS